MSLHSLRLLFYFEHFFLSIFLVVVFFSSVFFFIFFVRLLFVLLVAHRSNKKHTHFLNFIFVTLLDIWYRYIYFIVDIMRFFVWLDCYCSSEKMFSHRWQQERKKQNKSQQSKKVSNKWLALHQVVLTVALFFTSLYRHMRVCLRVYLYVLELRIFVKQVQQMFDRQKRWFTVDRLQFVGIWTHKYNISSFLAVTQSCLETLIKLISFLVSLNWLIFGSFVSYSERIFVLLHNAYYSFFISQWWDPRCKAKSNQINGSDDGKSSKLKINWH